MTSEAETRASLCHTHLLDPEVVSSSSVTERPTKMAASGLA